MDAGLIGRACIALGAGRAKASDAIDFAVGVSGISKIGTAVQTGEPLLTVHARSDETLKAALALIGQAIEIA
jgi:thymidine phosphorylase